jgi:gamma-glutamylcyclotransferase
MKIKWGNDYIINWVKSKDGTEEGFVINYSLDFSNRRKIPIKRINSLETKHRFLCMENSPFGPIIWVTGEFMALKIELREAGIWHEVGHVHHNHYMNENYQYTGNPNAERLKWLSQNKIAPEEAEADMFSVKKVGKENMLKSLNFLLETRRLLNEVSANAEKELSLRIKNIEMMAIERKNYFAYGSNLLIAQMNERCPNNIIKCKGILNDYKWIINKRGVANIIPSKEDFVEGLIYEITDADEYNLGLKEGVFKKSYNKTNLNIIGPNNETIDCLVYIDPIQETGFPKGGYEDRLIRGKRDAGLSHEYFEKYWLPFLEQQ